MKGHRSSGLLFNFWLLLLFCSIPQLRWEVNQFNSNNFSDDGLTFDGYNFISYVTFFSMVSIMLLINCFADKPPRNTTYPKYSNPSPELSSSYLRQIFYQWFSKTTWNGWRRPLTEKDIYDLNPADSCAELYPPFVKHFNNDVEKERKK